MRVSAFIDGFNLYHAIDDLNRPDLKWVNLRCLMEKFIDPGIHVLGDIYYFSAYCDWDREKRARHMAYVRALKHFDVTPVMANFKEKDMECFHCHNTWIAHEEKQTDVNIAVHLVREAYRDTYDRAFLVTSDSDLVPPLALLREIFPKKSVKVICPPERWHSKELCRYSKKPAKIQVSHLEDCRMQGSIATMTGLVTRPTDYKP
jgi:uncharacterized LabA/DUF88 family protein